MEHLRYEVRGDEELFCPRTALLKHRKRLPSDWRLVGVLAIDFGVELGLDALTDGKHSRALGNVWLGAPRRFVWLAREGRTHAVG